MTQLESEKKMDSSGYATQQPRLPKICGLSSFLRPKTRVKLLLYLAVVGLLYSAAYAKPTNPCTATQFWVENEDGSFLCEDCPSCPEGQGLSLKCGTRIPPTAMVYCVPCKAGVTFCDEHDSSSCTPCSSCAEDQVVLRNCTPEWDVKCGKQCNTNDSYYDEAKGDCLPCSKCCNDDQDVVEDECKEKLGAGSNMICSYHSSVNRCYLSTPSPHNPTTIENKSLSTHDYTTPSQGSQQEHTEPPTAQPRRKKSTTKTTSGELLESVGIPVACLILIIGGPLLYKYRHKARKMLSLLCCSCGTVTGITEPVVHYRTNGNLDAVETKPFKSGKVNDLRVVSAESTEGLLEKGNQEGQLVCSCQDGVEETFLESDNVDETGTLLKEAEEENEEGQECATQDSKLLSSLLDDELHLDDICECLDTPMGGLDYRPVAQHYGLKFYKIASLKRQDGGPTRALIVLLSATKPDLTVREFVTVVRKKAKRNDAAKLLEAFDSKKIEETSI